MKGHVGARLEILALSIIGALVVGANYLVFMVVPNERVMGPVQRIFYFHVGSAFACYCSVALMLVGAILYLATRKDEMDSLQASAGEVGFVFCTLVLVSGMIWAKSAWNTAFSFKEPRLVSFLLLWLIFLGFILLRRFGDRARLAQHSAVLSILGAITVPIVIYSVKILTRGQLHPQVVENQGLKDPSFKLAFWYCSFVLVLLQGFMVWLRYRVLALERRVEALLPE
jgi:heme exporter protein C